MGNRSAEQSDRVQSVRRRGFGADSHRLKKSISRIYGALYKRFGPQHWWPGDTAFEIIIGAILTQNTAWTNVEKAINNLKKRGLLTPKKLSRAKPSKIAGLIRPSGYYNIKSRRIMNFMSYLNARHGGNLKKMLALKTPLLRKELLEINGIGPETADSILLYAAARPVFVIDAYTRRIFSRHRIAAHDTPYDGLQRLFESSLPKSRRIFNEYHALIVRTGKEFCAKNPKCGGCPLQAISC